MRASLVLLALGAACGCGPRATLDRSHPVGLESGGFTTADVPVRGFEVEVLRRGEASDLLVGELLAIDEESLWVEDLGIIRVVSREEILEVSILEHSGRPVAGTETLDALFQWARYPAGMPDELRAAAVSVP